MAGIENPKTCFSIVTEYTLGKIDRFDLKDCKTNMKAVITTGNGWYDKLEYRDVPVPTLLPGEILLQVLAAGVNNTVGGKIPWTRDPAAELDTR